MLDLVPPEITEFVRPFYSLGEPSIGEWAEFLKSDLSREQLALFLYLRTSENIRKKIKENLDKP